MADSHRINGRRWTDVGRPARPVPRATIIGPLPYSRTDATSKQIAFLKGLLAQWGTESERTMSLEGMRRDRASGWIDQLLSRKKARATKPVQPSAPTPQTYQRARSRPDDMSATARIDERGYLRIGD